MGVATFAGRTFRIDPESVSWNFAVKTNDLPTVGGKVIQIYGTNVSDMTVIGSFGKAGWQGQIEFLNRMKEIATAQSQAGRTSRSQVPPARFTYPPRRWDFLVYLSGYNGVNQDKAVRHHNSEVNPKWKLTLFIVDDMSDLGVKKVAQDAYISRLAKGIGWKRTEFNGPFGSSNINELIGEGGGGTSGSESGSSFSTLPGLSSDDFIFPSAVEQWRPLVAKYFPAKYVNQALSVMKCESGGIPTARNSTPTLHGHAMGLFQHLEDYWAERAIAAGFAGRSPYDPEANIAASAWLFLQTETWQHWECKPSVLF